jgi:HSP20 family protein
VKREAEEDWGTWPKRDRALESVTLGNMRSEPLDYSGCNHLWNSSYRAEFTRGETEDVQQEMSDMIGGFRDPFEEIFGIQRALDEYRASDWLGARTAGMGSFPPINIFQRGHDFVAIIELAGIDKNDLEIEVKENTIRILGKKTINYEEGASMHRRERVSGVFDRTVSVPIQINADSIKAEYRDGILALFIPQAESEKPKTIKIK